MKATLNEYDGCFSIDLEAETVAEAAVITRMGMNSTTKLRSCDAYASTDGTFALSCVVAKAKAASSAVPHVSRP